LPFHTSAVLTRSFVRDRACIGHGEAFSAIILRSNVLESDDE